ncbi:MAG: endolytic transglycosylase MltG, partial [Lapillicoccus sp.]
FEHDDLEHDDLEHDDLEHHHLDGFGEDVPQTRAEARELEREQGGRRRRRGRGALVLLVTLALVAGAGWAAVTYLKPLLSFSSESSDYPGPGSGAVTITVKDGDTASAIGETLAQAGVVKTARAFAQAAAASPRGNSIQPGTYAMMSQMTAAAALAILIDPANRGGIPRVTIREGLWSSETFAALAKASGLPVSDYVAAAKNTAALGLPAAAKGRLEGYLFPATYEFPQGSSAADQLTMMVAKAVQELTALGISDTTMERTVIIASIVEAEGRIDTDRPKIARVIENRLAVPMRLQLDSTVSYGIQKRAITTSDAERADPNPFNTYAHDGLPVGPIGNPGLASLRAAINPTPGPWLYFVAVNPTTGETKFATTAAEHALNVAQFQQWCSANPGTC